MSKLTDKFREIVPFGDLPKEQEKDKKEFKKQEASFYENPMIPWWLKAAVNLVPDLKKNVRTTTWCKRCGRKHIRQNPCTTLHMVEDLTAPSTKFDKDGEPIPNKRVGLYSTKEPV